MVNPFATADRHAELERPHRLLDDFTVVGDKHAGRHTGEGGADGERAELGFGWRGTRLVQTEQGSSSQRVNDGWRNAAVLDEPQ